MAKPKVKHDSMVPLSGRRVMRRRPNEDVKRRLYQLEKDVGHPVDIVAQRWGVSPDTVIKQAQALACLRYVDEGEGKWTRCVLHPDTAKQYEE
jgi:hypothetical protein